MRMWVHVTSPHEHALIVTREINEFDVKMIVVYLGSSTNMLFFNALLSMEKTKRDLNNVDFSLIGFARRTTYRLDTINLPVV